MNCDKYRAEIGVKAELKGEGVMCLISLFCVRMAEAILLRKSQPACSLFRGKIEEVESDLRKRFFSSIFLFELSQLTYTVSVISDI